MTDPQQTLDISGFTNCDVSLSLDRGGQPCHLSSSPHPFTPSPYPSPPLVKQVNYTLENSLSGSY